MEDVQIVQSESSDSDSPPPIYSKISYVSYSQQLEEYINKYKTRPPDIKFWPYGPYWPQYYDGEILVTPRHIAVPPDEEEPLAEKEPVEDVVEVGKDEEDVAVSRTIDNQDTPYQGRWRGVLIVYDSERSPREHHPQPVPEACCPNLVFESRFESGNLRQARRVGQFEYELVLKTDLYTNRHTQWYYFRVKNAVPGVTYKFRIVNLLKRDSLYNYGMRPLLYSDHSAQERQVGWCRTGHHISYSRNVTYLHCPLLQRGITYYYLEWQMEFPNNDDTYYLAHCYPYTFTDLKDDLDTLLQDPERERFMRREVLCETRAGNSCFLITVTNSGHTTPGVKKKAVVVTARVHPGESQASWMMKGLLDFVTSSDPVAEKLRNNFIFKIVPMLNPDGVIVGNYRCSLAARDLNRNYRHPRRESFPTVWFVKNMVEVLQQRHEVLLYCDLHGHSRKHNVFMYGNNTSSEEDMSEFGAARTFINERLFPWLMSQKSPDKFSYPSCKFHIRKCKESTGRVVMWRQMKILNSFTLEATFSGTILNTEKCRHFNISDFMAMGRTLGEVVLDYHELQQNKARQTEVVLDLTRVITQDILASRGLIPPDTKIPNFTDLALRKQDSTISEIDADLIQEDAEKWTGAILSLVAKDREKSNLEDRQKEKVKKDDRKDSKGMKTVENGKQPSLTRKEVNQMIDNISLKTMDGCLNILTELNVREAIVDSDSSDSDSESEAEMKESKTRKKKRKSRKQRDREKKTPTPADKKEDARMKALSASLPKGKMMRHGNFGRPMGNFRGHHQGNFGARNQGNFSRGNQGNYGRYQNQGGGYNSGGRNNQGNRYQGKSPARNEPPKKPNTTPTKPTKPEDDKQVKPEQPKQEMKSPVQPPQPAQSPVKKDTSNTTPPAVQKPASSPVTQLKKEEPPKPAGNSNSEPKADPPTPQAQKQPQKQQQPPKQHQQSPKQQQQQQPPQQTPNQKYQQQKPQNNMNQDRPPYFQRQDKSQNAQNQRSEKPSFQNQRPKQGNKSFRERDSSFSRGDSSFSDLPQGPKEEKKFTGRCRLFVGNLTPDVTEDDFKKMFEQYGEVSEAYVNSGRGFGFIRMDYRHNAEAAKAALDGLQKKGRTLRVRFATHGAALKVKNIHPHASNELLESAFAQFGDLERAIVIVDDRGKPTGDGIVEFVRKPGAQQALRRINDGIFLLGSSPRPLVVEPLEQTDEDDGMPEKFVNKNEGYKKEREKEPRFAMHGSFEYEFAQRWRQIDDMERERIERVKKEMEDARLRLEDEMQGALIEYQADQIRKDLMRQQEELRRLEEMRQQDQMRRRQDMELRQREEEMMRAEEERRLQDMIMGRHGGPMEQGGPRGRDEMMGGMRDGPGPRGMKDGAPPLPPPPAPPAGMGLDRSGRPNQVSLPYERMQGNMGGNFSNSSGMGSGMSSGGGMGGGNSGGNMGGGMSRQSRFDQQGGSYESGFQSGGGMGGNMGGGPGGPGNMFGSQGMGGSNSGNMGSGSGQGMRGGDRMDRRREGGPRDDYGDIKRRRY